MGPEGSFTQWSFDAENAGNSDRSLTCLDPFGRGRNNQQQKFWIKSTQSFCEKWSISLAINNFPSNIKRSSFSREREQI